MTIINPAVGASSDDAASDNVETNLSAVGYSIGTPAGAGTYDYMGFRFTVTGPNQGDTVNNCYLRLYDYQGNPINVNVDFVAADDPATFGTAQTNISSRTLTGSPVTWSSAMTPFTFNDSPSLVTPMQAILNRAGWNSGQHVVVVIHALSATDTRIRTWDDSTSEAAILHLEYSASTTALTVANLSQTQSLSNILWNPLTVNDLSQSQSISTFSLIEHSILTVSNLSQSQSLGAVVLSTQGTLPITDSFTSAGDQTLNAYNSHWIINSGNFQVLGANDTARSTVSSTESGAHRDDTAFNDDQYAQVKMSARTNAPAGPAVRCASSGSTYYGYYGDSNFSYLFSMKNGVWAQLGSNGGPFIDGSTYRLEISGSSLRPMKDGATADIGIQVDSTNPILSGYGGICGYDLSGEIDDFEAGNLTASSISLTVNSLSQGQSITSPFVHLSTRETFEDISTGNWIVEIDAVGTNSNVSRSGSQIHSGSYSAFCYTTNSSAKAQVRDVINSTWAGVPSSDPGEYIWQHAYIYVPASTANALTGTEYLDLAGFYTSGSSGWYLRLKSGSALYISGPSSGQKEFNIYKTMPVDQWVELEIGLWSQNIEAGGRSFIVFINGDVYGWYRLGDTGTDYNRVAFGILNTNSTDDLIVYVDDWDLFTSGSNPIGTDNRLTSASSIIDFTSQIGQNIDFQYATWASAGASWQDATHGIGGFRSQAGPNSDKQRSNLESGWAEIVLDWAGGTTPAWPPDETWGTYYFAAMVAFKKYFPDEENLEIVLLYDYNNSNTVELTYESWVTGLLTYAAWEIPVATTVPGAHIPEPGDKIFVRWEEVSATNLLVQVNYYDASTDTWYNNVINDNRNMSNSNGVNWLDHKHNSVSITTETTKYAVRSLEYGTLETLNTLSVVNLGQGQSLGLVVLTQHNNLVSNNLSQSQSLEALALTQHNVLTNNNLSQSQAIDNIILIQHNALSLNNLTQSQSIENVNLAQGNSLSVNNLNQSQSIDGVLLTQHNLLSLNNLSQSESIDLVNITQHNILGVNNLSQAQSIESFSLTQRNLLNINNLSQSQSIENIVLTQHNILSVASLNQTQTIGLVDLAQHNILVLNNLSQNQVIGGVNLIQNYLLSINNLSQSQAIENVILIQHNILILANLNQAQTIGNVDLTVYTVGALTLQNVSQNQSIGAVVLTQHNVLIVQSLNQSQSVGLVSLVQHNVLIVQSLNQSQSVELLSLMQHNVLVAQSLIQSQSIDAIGLIQHNLLATNNLAQVQLLDGITLSQQNILNVANLLQSQIIDAVVLVQHNSLVVLSGNQAQAIDNVDLTNHAPSAMVLTVQNLNQTQSILAVSLTQHNILILTNVNQNQSIESIALVQHNILSNVANLAQLQSIESLNLIQNYVLIIQSLLSNQSVESYDLIQHNLLAINNVNQLQVIDNIDLIPHLIYVLVVVSLLQSQYMNNVIFGNPYAGIITPLRRTFRIDKDYRVYTINFENRRFEIYKEDRYQEVDSD